MFLIQTVRIFLYQQETELRDHVRRSSTYEMLGDVNPGVALHVFHKVDLEPEYGNPPSEASCLNTSAVGPGLDSDFGASAGTLQPQWAALELM